MKTNYLITLLFLSLPFIGAAQHEWAPVGTEWHFGVEKVGSVFGPTRFFYTHIVVEAETNILGQDCRAIRKDYYDIQDGSMSTSTFYTYDHNDSVYLYRPEMEIDFKLIFDFSAEQGDTLTFYAYNDNSPTLYDTTYYKVGEIGTYNLGNESLRHWKLDWLYGDYVIDVAEEYVEALGSLKAFQFISQHLIYDPRCIHTLQCFSDGSIDYNWGAPCDSMVTSNEDIFIDGQFVKIFPNPINHKTELLAIELPDFSINQEGSLRLINSLGQMVKSINMPYADYTYEVEVQDLTPGIYFLNVVVDGKIIQAQRVLLH